MMASSLYRSSPCSNTSRAPSNRAAGIQHCERCINPLKLARHHLSQANHSLTRSRMTEETPLFGLRQGTRLLVRAGAASACYAALFAAVTAGQTAISNSSSNALLNAVGSQTIPALLTAAGIFIICLAAAIFLICSLPTVWAFARLAHQATIVLQQVEKELPDTASLLRLSGLQVTDCITELSGLGADLSSGIRSTAKLATMTEHGVKKTVAVVKQNVLPAIAATENTARNALESGLQERANLPPILPTISEAASNTAQAVRKIRAGLSAAGLANQAVQLGRSTRDAYRAAKAANANASATNKSSANSTARPSSPEGQVGRTVSSPSSLAGQGSSSPAQPKSPIQHGGDEGGRQSSNGNGNGFVPGDVQAAPNTPAKTIGSAAVAPS